MIEGARSPAWPIALVAVLLLDCGVPGMEESHYPTLALAIADGAVAQGWVPDLLPADATDIWETHDLDTEEVWLRFTFARDALPGLLRVCAEVDALHVAYARATRRLSWWPEELQRAAAAPTTPFHFFRCPAPDRYPGQSYTVPTFLALTDRDRTAWYWRRP